MKQKAQDTLGPVFLCLIHPIRKPLFPKLAWPTPQAGHACEGILAVRPCFVLT